MPIVTTVELDEAGLLDRSRLTYFIGRECRVEYLSDNNEEVLIAVDEVTDIGAYIHLGYMGDRVWLDKVLRIQFPADIEE